MEPREFRGIEYKFVRGLFTVAALLMVLWIWPMLLESTRRLEEPSLGFFVTFAILTVFIVGVAIVSWIERPVKGVISFKNEGFDDEGYYRYIWVGDQFLWLSKSVYSRVQMGQVVEVQCIPFLRMVCVLRISHE